VAADKFAELVDAEILMIIDRHSHGRENATILEKIIMLADWIEENRTIEFCVNLRDNFYHAVESGTSPLHALYDALIVKYSMRYDSYGCRRSVKFLQWLKDSVDKHGK